MLLEQIFNQCLAVNETSEEDILEQIKRHKESRKNLQVKLQTAKNGLKEIGRQKIETIKTSIKSYDVKINQLEKKLQDMKLRHET